MKRFAILNPVAGNGKTGRLQRQLLEKISDIIGGYAVSEYPGHCSEIAARESSADVFVAIGGDGTIGEVVNGMDCTRQRLAVIPTGTGNSLARDMGIRTLKQAFTRVHAEGDSPIDLLDFSFTFSDGTAGRRLCTSTASIGYAARVTDLANRHLKKLGPLCYPVASFYAALRNSAIPLHVSVDGEQGDDLWRTGIIFQNVRFAANFELFPDTCSSDGSADLMETDAGFFGQVLHIVSVLTRLGFYRPVSVRSAASVDLELQHPQLLMIDGEIVRDIIRVSMKVKPGALRCCR